MSDAAEKTLEPTPHRLRKARQEGDVARSAELGANIAFAASGCATAAVVPSMAAFARQSIALASTGQVPLAAVGGIFATALVPLGCAAVAGSLAALAQNGGLHVTAPAPKLERLNPVGGLKRMLSRETFAHCARAALAFAIASALMLPAIHIAAVEMSWREPVLLIAQAVGRAAERVAGIAFVVGTAFAIAEYAAARRSWLRKLRMSFDERKREMKEEEGDPFERGRRRALHRSLLRGSLADVKKASFVVVNPTHVAIALRYDPPVVSVPTLLVRAAGEVAVRVKYAARRHRIPVVKDVALARALFRDGRVGSAIDRTHFVAVAEVVAALAREGLLDA